MNHDVPTSEFDSEESDLTLTTGHGRSRRRSEYVTRDLTKGSIPRNLWFLAWPQMIEGGLNMLDRVADLFWAGRFFGIHAIGGLAIAQLYTGLIMTGRQGLDMGMQAMIARAVGAGNIRLANHVALQALTITTLFSVAMVAIGVLYTDFLLKIVSTDWDSYQRFLTKRLTAAPNVSVVKSALAIRTATHRPDVPINVDSDYKLIN
mgnify:CR=1 FL=1